MHIQSRGTVVFLLLAAAAFAIAATGNFLTVWAWLAGGLFLVLALLFWGRTYSQTFQKPMWRILLLAVLLILIVVLVTLFSLVRNRPAWRDDSDVQQAEAACYSLDEAERYACIEQQAVASLNPDVCRLANKFIDDMCLQMVYEAADDPAICEQLYLESVRPNCEAFYARKGDSNDKYK